MTRNNNWPTDAQDPLQYKDDLSRYGYGYLYDKNSYTGKTIYLYWARSQDSVLNWNMSGRSTTRTNMIICNACEKYPLGHNILLKSTMIAITLWPWRFLKTYHSLLSHLLLLFECKKIQRWLCAFALPKCSYVEYRRCYWIKKCSVNKQLVKNIINYYENKGWGVPRLNSNVLYLVF